MKEKLIINGVLYGVDQIIYNGIVIKDRYEKIPYTYNEKNHKLQKNYCIIKDDTIDPKLIIACTYQVGIFNTADVDVHIEEELYNRLSDDYREYIKSVDNVKITLL